MKVPSSAARFIAALASITVAMHVSNASAQYYKGKTISIIVGVRAGGTVDTFARSFVDIWSKHIPGHPTMIVKNMTGSGTMRAQNYVYEVAKPDGLTVYWGPWDPIAQALKVASLRADYGNIEFLGGTGAVHVTYVRSDILPRGRRITRPEQIMQARADFKIGGSTATSIPTILNTMSLKVLGVKYKFVGGYRGGSGVRAAMLRNEVQGYQSSITTFRRTGKDQLASGKWIGLYYLVPVEADGSFEHNKYIHEMPTFPDLYRKIHGKPPSGPQWEALKWLVNLVGDMSYIGYVRKGTPKEAVVALRKGYAEGVKDPDFVKPAMKRYGIPYRFVDVSHGTKLLTTIKGVDPAVLTELNKVIHSTQGG